MFLSLELNGATWALIGFIRLILGFATVAASLRIVGLRVWDVGLVSERLREDAIVGAAVAVVFALLQFLVAIPATG